MKILHNEVPLTKFMPYRSFCCQRFVSFFHKKIIMDQCCQDCCLKRDDIAGEFHCGRFLQGTDTMFNFTHGVFCL